MARFPVVFASLCLVSAVVPPMPAFLWTPSSQILTEGRREVTQSISTSALADLVSHLSGESKSAPSEFAPFLAASSFDLEAVVVFVHPKLCSSQVSTFGDAFSHASEGGAFKSLKTSLASSSSLTFPYVFKTSTFDIVSELRKVPNVRVVSAKDAITQIGETTFSADRTEVLVVVFSESLENSRDTFAAADMEMQQILNAVSRASHNKFFAISTASSPGASPFRSAINKSSQKALSEAGAYLSIKSRVKSDGYTDDDVLYMTPAILSAILIGLVFLLTTCCGVCGLLALKTPDRWEGEGEYLSAK